MTTAKKAAPATTPAAENVVATAGDAKLVLQTGETETTKPQKAGERGPKSVLEGGLGSREYAEANASGKQVYSVQVHTDAKGLEVLYFGADGGDDAANQALKAKGYKGVSIRGVDVASAPDPNSMGGEREAAIMIANAQNNGHIVNTLGTDANAEATAKLAKADIKDLGE